MLQNQLIVIYCLTRTTKTNNYCKINNLTFKQPLTTKNITARRCKITTIDVEIENLNSNLVQMENFLRKSYEDDADCLLNLETTVVDLGYIRPKELITHDFCMYSVRSILLLLSIVKNESKESTKARLKPFFKKWKI